MTLRGACAVLASVVLMSCLTVPLKQISPTEAARLHDLGPLNVAPPKPASLKVIIPQEVGAATVATLSPGLSVVATDSSGNEVSRQPYGMFLSNLYAANSADRGRLIEGTAGTVDPGKRATELFAARLQKEFGFAELKPIPDGGPSPASGVRMEVYTVGYFLANYPADWSHHFLVYQSQVKLFRASDGQLVWEAMCNTNNKREGTSRTTLEELVTNGGAKYAAAFDEVTSLCATQWADQLAGRRSPIKAYR